VDDRSVGIAGACDDLDRLAGGKALPESRLQDRNRRGRRLPRIADVAVRIALDGPAERRDEEPGDRLQLLNTLPGNHI
jgi:hypothetical protein